MKRLILIVVLFFILATMYGYHLGRLESYVLLRANPSATNFLPTLQLGASVWDQFVFWSGPIFALLIIFPALRFVFEIYYRDQMQRAPLEVRIITQLKEWLKEPDLRYQQEASEKSKTNPASG